MFDFRAHGRSAGRITTLGALERKDVQAAVGYALSRGSSRVGLLGFSMGGRAAILSASSIPRVNAIVCDSAPVRLSTAISKKLITQKNPAWLSHIAAFLSLAGASLLSGINLFRAEPLHQAGRLSGIPTLLIYGGKDPYITSSEIERMVSAAGEHAQIWIVPEAGHRDVEKYRQEEYKQMIKDFFHKNLQLPPEES